MSKHSFSWHCPTAAAHRAEGRSNGSVLDPPPPLRQEALGRADCASAVSTRLNEEEELEYKPRTMVPQVLEDWASRARLVAVVLVQTPSYLQLIAEIIVLSAETHFTLPVAFGGVEVFFRQCKLRRFARLHSAFEDRVCKGYRAPFSIPSQKVLALEPRAGFSPCFWLSAQHGGQRQESFLVRTDDVKKFAHHALKHVRAFHSKEICFRGRWLDFWFTVSDMLCVAKAVKFVKWVKLVKAVVVVMGVTWWEVWKWWCRLWVVDKVLKVVVTWKLCGRWWRWCRWRQWRGLVNVVKVEKREGCEGGEVGESGGEGGEGWWTWRVWWRWRRIVNVEKFREGGDGLCRWTTLVKVVNIWEVGQGGGCGEGSPWWGEGVGVRGWRRWRRWWTWKMWRWWWRWCWYRRWRRLVNMVKVEKREGAECGGGEGCEGGKRGDRGEWEEIGQVCWRWWGWRRLVKVVNVVKVVMEVKLVKVMKVVKAQKVVKVGEGGDGGQKLVKVVNVVKVVKCCEGCDGGCKNVKDNMFKKRERWKGEAEHIWNGWTKTKSLILHGKKSRTEKVRRTFWKKKNLKKWNELKQRKQGNEQWNIFWKGAKEDNWERKQERKKCPFPLLALATPKKSNKNKRQRKGWNWATQTGKNNVKQNWNILTKWRRWRKWNNCFCFSKKKVQAQHWKKWKHWTNKMISVQKHEGKRSKHERTEILKKRPKCKQMNRRKSFFFNDKEFKQKEKKHEVKNESEKQMKKQENGETNKTGGKKKMKHEEKKERRAAFSVLPVFSLPPPSATMSKWRKECGREGFMRFFQFLFCLWQFKKHKMLLSTWPPFFWNDTISKLRNL